MRTSYDYYRTFYYVAIYQSFNKAAAVLQTSQPNVSRSMNNLEHQLGVKLFVRSPFGVTLTKSGEELFEHVEVAYKHIKAGEELMSSNFKLEHGILTIGFSIGITYGIMRSMMTPVIHQFHKQYPDIRLRIMHMSTATLVSEISNDLMDIAFITTPHEDNQDKAKYNKHILHPYRDIAIAGQSFSALKGRKVTLEELADYPIISLGSRTETFAIYRNYFADKGLEFHPAIETTSTGQSMFYALDNLGIAFIHPMDVANEIENNQVFQIDLSDKLPKRNIAMISNKKISRAATEFDRMIREKYAALQKDNK